MNLKPLGDKVIVKRLEAKEKSEGGIILPEAAKEKPQEGEVIAVGSGKTLKNGKTVAPQVKPGDKILFGKYSGNEIKLDDQEYLIVESEEILAIVT